jgi:hypothetical protein
MGVTDLSLELGPKCLQVFQEIMPGLKRVLFPYLEGRQGGRMFYLVDKEGIIRGKWIGEDMAVFSNEPLLKTARELSGM